MKKVKVNSDLPANHVARAYYLVLLPVLFYKYQWALQTLQAQVFYSLLSFCDTTFLFTNKGPTAV